MSRTATVIAPRGMMASEWRDPEDIMPSARRSPRMIKGWRTFCPLRRMSGHPSSCITAQHILAADKLRELVDVATIGYSGERPLIYVQTQALPRTGITASQIAAIQAARAVQRVGRLFTPMQCLMIEAVILQNMTVRAWTKTRTGAHPNVEKGRLLAILDVLCQHFETEIQQELATGARDMP
jgi:hypothetical protein